MAAKDPPQFSYLPRIINGGIAGIVGVTCVFPIDLVKTRMQNQQIGPGGERMYKSLLDCGRKTLRNEGFLGMYRGAGVNLLLITPEKALKLVCNDVFRHKLTNSQGYLHPLSEMAAGGGAGMCQIIVTTPMELLKIQLQDAGRTAGNKNTQGMGTVPIQARGHTTSAAPPKISATSIAMKLVKERGILGLYKGLGATAMRDITFSAIYFPLFAHLNHLGKNLLGLEENVFYVSLVSGICAGAVASVSVNPFDVVKTRLQTLSKAKGERVYTGVSDAILKTYTHEGWTAFFKGGFARMIVIAPLFGIAQGVYYLGVAESLLGYPMQR